MTVTKNVPKSLANNRLDKVAASLFPDFSRTQIKKWILEGRILINGDLSKPKDMTQENDEIEINPIEEKKVSWDKEDINFDVIYDCDDYIIVNKNPELVNLPRSGIVHRLDKDTSGVLLIARTEKFRNYFIQQMQERNVKKEYIAVVVGSTLGSFSIEDPIGRDKFNRTKMSIRVDGKEARTLIKLNERINNYSVLDVSIETGRTHQIRVHLSSKKLPIVGDKTYDPAKSVAKESSPELVEIIRSFPRQALHAKLLSFECPETKKQISYEAAIPKDINNLILDIKKHS
ncbi:MAG: RluA family pseudouridine synthase [Proteobacteria bacterium]|nr:RluA family pseudouridine synthase [Pseudomonadota bacterium]